MKRQVEQETKHPGSMRFLVGGVVAGVAILGSVVAATTALSTGAPAGGGTMIAAASATSSHQGLAARESHFDFGPISMASGKVSHRFWIRNEGSGPLKIERIYTSCMCTTASLIKSMRVVGRYGMPGHGPLAPVSETLAPNEAAYLDVVFDPAAHGPAGLGRTERVVTVEHAGGAPLQLGFTAYVRP